MRFKIGQRLEGTDLVYFIEVNGNELFSGAQGNGAENNMWHDMKLYVGNDSHSPAGGLIRNLSLTTESRSPGKSILLFTVQGAPNEIATFCRDGS